jgi:hypothetical protein
MHTKFESEYLHIRDHLGDPDIEGRVIIKWILMEKM